MSWSVSAVGKSEAVRASIAAQFAKGSGCVEPEETVRQAAAACIDAALAAQSGGAVEASGSGHQSTDYATKVVTNNLTITVKPIYGFVE